MALKSWEVTRFNESAEPLSHLIINIWSFMGRERKESQLLFLAFAATSAAVFRLGSASSSIFELNAQQGVSFRPLDRSLFQAPNWEGTINGRYWVKNAHVEPRKELNVPLAATFAKPVVVEEFY
ncbi:uncharacterized protein LOC121248650 isoform X2 [Juglans microcarpa x Juglans regia]|uniref:uncharacterized protein LOC121248650 isoform X2 n=1 Tax=Juglans microcarpa x Juglans regia TaxID=2249226 RepID=UPI001B7E3DF2|nr:uncharacterized protein LOC121248650 isoform X2 [Juglans microcarpa x Juglans regia]